MSERQIIQNITQIINELSAGNFDFSTYNLENEIASCNSTELKELYQSVSHLIDKHRNAKDFILNLSKGNLEIEVPKTNNLISSFKELHSNLRHLVWQTHRIAEGDYNQHIDFLGDFSNSYNKLIAGLKEKQIIEKELEASETQYRILAENVSDVIWKLDLFSGRFTYISPSIYALRGYSVEEAMAQTMEESLTPESVRYIQENLPKRIQAFYTGDESARAQISEVQQPCKDGSIIWVEVVTTFITNKDNKIVEILGVSRNIESRKKAAEQLQLYAMQLEELNATKDKFFSIIAHDLRNPFGAIHNLAELLLENIEIDNKQLVSKIAKLLYDSSKHTFELLQNLLEWAKIQQGGLNFKPELLDLSFILNEETETLAPLINQKEISLELSIPADIQITADKYMLRSIFRNLLTNAVKFTPNNGSVTVKALNDNNNIIIAVKDTGIGLSSDEQERLFKIDRVISKNGTNNERGTGLGLMLCNEFVKKHNGEISVESTSGKGSTFRIVIPQEKNTHLLISEK
ncbi:MAG: PAS domain-containing sensor histidine kinase [Bacteroidota bacterium]|nr:PAS domain-containing sensor histidine kinase [Bacteroidota bacterium]